MSVNRLNKEKFNIQGKDITLYKSDDYNVPLIIFNTYEGDGEEVYNILNDTESINCNLLVAGNLKWNHDISPWPVPAIYPKEEPFGGGADECLKLLKDKILPMAREKINGEPKFTGIAGYSLAGLFAVYAMYNADIKGIRMTITVLASLPIFALYPFMQKYFSKGIMVGAVKG